MYGQSEKWNHEGTWGVPEKPNPTNLRSIESRRAWVRRKRKVQKLQKASGGGPGVGGGRTSKSG